MNQLLSPTAWRSAWRQLRAEPGPAALVVLGLALGLALSLLAAAMVRDKLWADAGLPEAERLITFEWRVRGPGGSTSEWFADVPASALRAGLRESQAPVGPMSRALNAPLPARADDGHGGQRHARLWTLLADPDLRELFALRAVAGDLAAAMASPEGVALTEAAALKLFGTTQALGRQLTAAVSLYGEAEPRRLEVTLTVMAILPSPNPHGTLGSYDALAGINAPAAKEFVAQETSWTFSAGHLYARLQPGATAALLTQQAQHLLDQQPLPPDLPADFLKGGGKFAYLRALPVADIALHGAGSPLRRLQLGSLALAAAGVLGLAVINFVNLWGVRTLRRQREIGLRKSLGAGAAQLAAQFFIEALAVAGLAGALGLLLAWWSEPVAAALLQQSFTAPLLSAASLGLTALLCVAIATASALPLTLIALRVRPAASLAGRSHSEGTASRWLRRTMTALQFGTAAVFSALSLTVLWQVAHAGRIDRGFDVRGRVAVSLPWQAQAAQTRALLTRIQAWPEVTAAAASDDVPGRDFARWFSEYRGPNGQPLNLRRGGDFTPGLLQLYGMRLRAGQLSVDHAAEVAQHGVVLDVRATRALGFGSPSAAIGQRLSPSNPDRPAPTVVAVIDDIRLEGARDAPHPHLLTPVQECGPGAISVASRDPAVTAAKLTALVNEAFPDAAEPALPVSAQLARSMEDDTRLGRIIGIAGLLALGLAAVGIYALAAYTLRRREREIVLRKLHGAGAGAVAGLLAREFAGVLAAACAVALPVAAWLSQHYLAGFAERAPVGPASLWVLLAATALLTAVTALAVARHLRAALALRPLQALRG